MSKEELDQHRVIDRKFHKLETYQFETQLRGLVEKFIKPIRNM